MNYVVVPKVKLVQTGPTSYLPYRYSIGQKIVSLFHLVAKIENQKQRRHRRRHLDTIIAGLDQDVTKENISMADDSIKSYAKSYAIMPGRLSAIGTRL